MSVRRHLAITFSAKYIELALGFISSIILARLLTPEDFGVYSIAASIVLIGYLFRNFGVGQYIVQVENLTDEDMRAAFTITLTISWGIGVLLAAGAPWVAAFYDHAGVAEVLYFLALNFFLLPFGAITDAVLRRRLEFGKLAIIAVSAAMAGLVVAVSAAWLGAKYMAIVWAANASTLTTILLTFVYRPSGLPWRPGLKGVRAVFDFGLKVGVLDAVNKGSDSVTEMTIGKVHGLHDLGIYSRAYGAFMLFEYAFIEGIRPIVLPHLSEAKRENVDLSRVYLRIVSYASIVMLPFFAFMAISALDVLRVLYGDQWDMAAPVLQVLCATGVFLAPTVFFDQLLIAKGRPGQALFYQGGAQLVRLVALMLLVSGGLQLAAVAVLLGGLARALLVLYMANRHLSLYFRQFMQVMLPAVLTMFVVAVTVWAVSFGLQDVSMQWLRLAALSLSALLSWLLVIFLLQHPLTQEITAAWRRVRLA